MSFTDNFSRQAELYSQFRPAYPKELFEYLAGQTNEHELAWDCGTGNGQAAVGLTAYYTSIIATDPSSSQIMYAQQHPQIRYAIQRAEDFSCEEQTVDLITVANALHWFDLDTFFPIALRTLKPSGIFAAWAYGIPKISPAIDSVLLYYHDQIVGEYWTFENRLVENHYTGIDFPFQTMVAPLFKSFRLFNFNDLMNYLRTWSATQKYMIHDSIDPTVSILTDLSEAWADDPKSYKQVTWHLILYVGRP